MRGEKEAEGVLWGKLAKKEETSKNLLKMSEISLWIDDYDDIFSDFDPRPFAVRALSDDFLLEARKAIIAKPDGRPELKFLIPLDKRDVTLENIIRRRLKDYFEKHKLLEKKEISQIKKRGVSLIFVGFVMMLISSFLYSNLIHISSEVWRGFLIILTEPAGWFLFWIGGEQLFYEVRRKRPDIDFYKKMTEAEISFSSY